MIVSLEEAVKIANKLHREGKKVVTTNGCFDILHVGHVRYLAKARQFGDALFIGLNSDVSIKKIKNAEKRPIIPEEERAELLDSLKSVNYVFLFDDATPNSWVEKIKPDFHVKAADKTYGIEQCIERFAVQKGGGKVILVPKTEGKSTTKIVEKIMNMAKNPSHRSAA